MPYLDLVQSQINLCTPAHPPSPALVKAFSWPFVVHQAFAWPFVVHRLQAFA